MPRVRRCREPSCHAIVALPHWYCTKHIEHEAAYLEHREQFATKHSKTYERHYNKVTRKRNEVKADQERLYHSAQWTKGLRPMTLERDHYIDQYAKMVGIILQGNLVDHIVPVEYDPTLAENPANLVTTSYKMHKIKTKWEQEYYGTGQGNELKEVAEIKRIEDLPCFKNFDAHEIDPKTI